MRKNHVGVYPPSPRGGRKSGGFSAPLRGSLGLAFCPLVSVVLHVRSARFCDGAEENAWGSLDGCPSLCSCTSSSCSSPFLGLFEYLLFVSVTFWTTFSSSLYGDRHPATPNNTVRGFACVSSMFGLQVVWMCVSMCPCMCVSMCVCVCPDVCMYVFECLLV